MPIDEIVAPIPPPVKEKRFFKRIIASDIELARKNIHANETRIKVITRLGHTTTGEVGDFPALSIRRARERAVRFPII